MEQKYWLAENGTVRCLDDRCPQECDMGCPIYLQTIAMPYLQNGHFQEAASYLEKAVTIEPTFAEAWNNLAACYGQMGNHQRAYECYLKSFDLLEKPKPLYGMAVAMKNLGKYANAMQYVKMYEKRYGLDEKISAVQAEITEKQENKSKSKFVKRSRNGKYGLWDSDGRFLFCSSDEKKPEVFTTAANYPITTSYRKLADAMLEDLDTYGPQSEDQQSIARWQLDLVNDYIRLKAPEFADVVKKECLSEPDWTESINKQDAWTLFFRHTLLDRAGIEAWIDKCTHMQLNAILHVYRALKSARIALSVARVMECIAADPEDKLEIITKWIVDNSEYSYPYVAKIISDFKLYYGIHLEEHGDLFDGLIDYEEDQFFVGQKVSEEILIGRNYYLYEEGLRAKDQPKHYEPDDIALDCSSDDEDDEENEEESEEPEYDELEAFVPECCWIRRISALEDGQESYFLIAVTVDEDYTITGVTCVHETVSQQGGGLFFFTPGLFDSASTSEYEELDFYPPRVFDELAYLVKGRALKPGFSIIGKPIPQWMRDHNEYNTFALQSGYRSAYTHISIESDDDWCFTDLEYSSYQSSNSAYGDMFSRPQTLSDREDEAVDMLLYIIDHYTDEEWKEASK